MTALGAGAAVATAAWDTWAATSRRFTGSVPATPWKSRRGSTTASSASTRRGGGFPSDRRPSITPTSWPSPSNGSRPPSTAPAGWYSIQEWEGVRLRALLERAGVTAGGWRSVEVRSITGFSRWFGAGTLDDIWPVTAVAGQALTYGHGFPARIAAPSRRGFWWVKWVTSIQPFFPVS
ncbi:molybdopterin-dependent oxidoreductase [Actinoplanes sp. NPDC048796]|uniref:molybdopterin-dependent oxidoreductase n=1 Tax=Actinoplanes sp. NPDC048796 TaxID=3155640 RepID=UPI0033D61E55